MLSRLLTAFIVLMPLAGCDNQEPPAPPEAGPPSGDVAAAPGDRLGWTQRAGDAIELAAFQYALYVDGNRVTLAGASCAPSAAEGFFDCSAALPSMTPGVHMLELAAFVFDGSTTVESPRSGVLRVVVPGGAASALGAASAGPTTLTTTDQVRLTLTPVTSDLREPTDLAFAPDGSIFIAERGGTVRLVEQGVLAVPLALDLSGEVRLPEGGLLALTADPRFAENGMMFALYAAAAPRAGLEFVVARFRFANGRFAERAVLLDRIAASPYGANGALRIGPDGKLYVALDSSSDGVVASSLGSYNGKVLRLNLDASTPDDQAGMTPVFSLNHPQPDAIDWQPATGALWVIDRVGTADAGRLSAVAVDNQKEQRASVRTAYTLPAGTGPGSAAFYRGDRIPAFRGDLFVAGEKARELIRLRFDPKDPLRINSVERLLKDQIGDVRVVAEAPDGLLYLASDTTLYRLHP